MNPSNLRNPLSLPIRLVALRTGLTVHVIRAWERRYGAVHPQRTPGNRRLFGDPEVERLALLRRAVESGRHIGEVARLSTEELAELVRSGTRGPASAARPAVPLAALRARCRDAIRGFAAGELDSELRRSRLRLDELSWAEDLVGPLLEEVGQAWREGEIGIAQEHMVAAIVRSLLEESLAAPDRSGSDPVGVVATPAGQRHELGALLVATLASSHGWRVLYLGADVPADEIASAATNVGARLVALSLVYPEGDPHLADELTLLRDRLGSDTTILAGGRAAPSYALPLERVSGLRVLGLANLCTMLEDLRVA